MGESDIEPCAIARSLGVLGERWTFLIVREALWGATRFGEFRDALGVAPTCSPPGWRGWSTPA